MAFKPSSTVVSGGLVFNPECIAFLISSCSCVIALSASSTSFFTTAISLSTHCSINFSISYLVKRWVSPRFPTASFLLDRKKPNAPRAWTLSASGPLLPSFAWWCGCVQRFINLPYLPAGSRKEFIFGPLPIVSSVDFVDGWDVGCCRIWTTWMQAASFMSKVVHLIGLNKAQSVFWPSLHWE